MLIRFHEGLHMLFAQVAPAVDPSPWLQGGAAGAVLLCTALFLWALKWVVERLSNSIDRGGDKMVLAIEKLGAKLDDAHPKMLTALAENTQVSERVVDTLTIHENAACRRHEEVMRSLNQRA